MADDIQLILRDIPYPASYSFRVDEIREAIPETLPYVIDRASLAHLTGVDLKSITWLLQKCPGERGETFIKNTLYECYKIPKPQTAKDIAEGKQRYRHIQNPHNTLKFMQRNFMIGFWSLFPLPDYVTSFRKGFSIQDAARLHTGSPLVLAIDLENFFPSISESMVRSFLLDHGYPYEVSRTLSELSTYHAFLPQGSPSSPVISNLIGYHRFDKEIEKVANAAGFLYTRYADDLIFSASSLDAAMWGKADDLCSAVYAVVERAGFRVSYPKTKFMRETARQKVLGSVVNTPPEHDPDHGNWGHIRIPMEDYLNTRAKLHDALLNGLDAAGARHDMSGEGFLKHLEGYINSYVKQTDERRWLKLSPILDIIKWRHRKPSIRSASDDADISINPSDSFKRLEAEFAKLAAEKPTKTGE